MTFADNPNRSVAILQIRNSGIGDMLSQVDFFYWLCSYYSLTPLIFLEESGHRNEIPNHEIFHLLGFDSAVHLASHFESDASIALHSFLKDFSNIPKCQRYFVRVDSAYYSDADVPRFNRKVNPAEVSHPELQHIVRQGSLYTRIKLALATESNKQKIVVHVRRGDVAQVELSVLGDLLCPLVDRTNVAHSLGIFTRSQLRQSIPSSNFDRFLPLQPYVNQLRSSLANISGEVDIVLLSDGMTILSRVLKNRHPEILINRNTSTDTIESTLQTELDPIITLCNRHLIGENRHNLIDTIIEGLTSNTIISKSPGFLRRLASLFDCQIDLIYASQYNIP